MKRPPHKAAEVQVECKETAFQGYFQVDRYTLKHPLHRGGSSGSLVREVFERGHVAALLPVDFKRQELVLIEQFRPGAHAAGWYPWLLECVAGVIEEGETAPAVARRECTEETGLDVARTEFVCRYLTSPGAGSETHHLYIGEVDTSAAGGVHGLASEGEDILVHRCSFDAAFALMANGEIVNSKTLIALQWLQLHGDRLQREWAQGS